MIEKYKGINVAIIAGYDVLADESIDHQLYVEESVHFSLLMDADIIILVGGKTNPDYPVLTEADANYKLLWKSFKKNYEILILEKREFQEQILRQIRKENDEIIGTMLKFKKGKLPKQILPVLKLETGDTSADTLNASRIELIKNNIPVNKLILCAEQSRLAGFLLDALMVEILDLSNEIVTYGYPFPESEDNFDSQRRKMLLKICSHKSKFFNFLRNLWQKRHQRKVAKQKRNMASKS